MSSDGTTRCGKGSDASSERACLFPSPMRCTNCVCDSFCMTTIILWLSPTIEPLPAFEVLDGRGAAEAKRVISPEAKGIVTTDRYWSYDWLAGRRRQVCWAHLRRDFQAMVDRGGESAVTGRALLEQGKRLFKLWHQLRAGDLSHERLASLMRPVRREVKR